MPDSRAKRRTTWDEAKGPGEDAANQGIYACIAMHHPSFVGETKGHRGVRYLCCFAYGSLKTSKIRSSQPAISTIIHRNEFHRSNQFVRSPNDTRSKCSSLRNDISYYPYKQATVTTPNPRLWQERSDVLGYVGTSIEFHWERSGMKAM